MPEELRPKTGKGKVKKKKKVKDLSATIAALEKNEVCVCQYYNVAQRSCSTQGSVIIIRRHPNTVVYFYKAALK